MSETAAPYITQHNIKFQTTGRATAPGKFEVICITAGNGNGWQFSAQVLKDSLELWEGVHCFLDHAWFSRSVRDVAGMITDPVWDEDTQGIHATLKAFGPGGDLLTEFGKQILSEKEEKAKPRIGFSADLHCTTSNKDVRQILRINSLDLVYNPARGGAFLRALNSIQKEGYNMPEQTDITNQEQPQLPYITSNPGRSAASAQAQPQVEPTGGAPADAAARDQVLVQLQKDQAAMRQMLGETQRQAQLDQALVEARQTRIQMCEYLLDSALATSKLPKPMQERIRKQFAGTVFEAGQLQEVIKDSRNMLSELTANQAVSGPGRITAVFNEKDKLQAAVNDMFSIPRDEKLQSVKVPALSGVRELYLMLTGDHELHGGYHPDRVQLATTADFTGLVKNALNKIVTNTWEMLGRAGYDWWQLISKTEHFGSLHDITGTLVGTVGDLPSIAEGAEYTEIEIGDSPETASFTKYGGYIPLTLELIDRDETRKLAAYARELASAGLRKISRLVAAIFTANSDVGPTMADTGALFNATAVTTAGGHANLLTTALGTSQWDTVCQAVYNQPMLIKNAAGHYGTGPKMAVNPKFCLVPRSLQKTAYEILTGEFVRESNYVYDNVLKGSGVPVVVPEWTDANNWAAACDPNIAPAIYVGERFGIQPEIYVAGDELSPAVFMNDEHRLKVRHYLAVWVNDFRPLHKSNVA